MSPLRSTPLTFHGRSQFSSRPLDYFSSERGIRYIFRIHAWIISHYELRAHASPSPCVPVAPMTLQAK